MTADEKYMQRALELGQLGLGHVSPNPLVGCVIVHDDIIIGEGWHKQYGKAHAEVNAITDVEDKSLINQSTVYVNLEPCAHVGKTPPCADLLIKSGVKRVVIANEDPNPLVNGKGIQKLLDANIEVEGGLCSVAGLQLNKRFFNFMRNKRPFIILKWAQTANGLIARENFDSKWISNEFSRQLVHKWRAEEDAILVGFNTAANDNPQLSVRDWKGKNPVRIVIDSQLQLSRSLHLFNQSQQTICYNFLKNEDRTNLIFVRLEQDNWIQGLLTDLFNRKIQSVIIEGGAKTLNLFLKCNLWDEARVFTSSKTFGKGIPAPAMANIPYCSERIQGDELNFYNNY
ncbi:MAG TPA: bifunctional diaminohydroxyphosphoribosylaminopyrimidine deaminase/5-amino-6-(5-phosphoribosylamino)uracil reductase RibD [Cyclobacteriaceae bacterium]